MEGGEGGGGHQLMIETRTAGEGGRRGSDQKKRSEGGEARDLRRVYVLCIVRWFVVEGEFNL